MVTVGPGRPRPRRPTSYWRRSVSSVGSTSRCADSRAASARPSRLGERSPPGPRPPARRAVLRTHRPRGRSHGRGPAAPAESGTCSVLLVEDNPGAVRAVRRGHGDGPGSGDRGWTGGRGARRRRRTVLRRHGASGRGGRRCAPQWWSCRRAAERRTVGAACSPCAPPRRYRRTRTCTGIDLDVAEGAVVGLIGANGEGKTTLSAASWAADRWIGLRRGWPVARCAGCGRTLRGPPGSGFARRAHLFPNLTWRTTCTWAPAWTSARTWWCSSTCSASAPGITTLRRKWRGERRRAAASGDRASPHVRPSASCPAGRAEQRPGGRGDQVVADALRELSRQGPAVVLAEQTSALPTLGPRAGTRDRQRLSSPPRGPRQIPRAGVGADDFRPARHACTSQSPT